MWEGQDETSTWVNAGGGGGGAVMEGAGMGPKWGGTE